MTRHRRVRLLLYDYVRRGLDAADTRMVDRHLGECPECRLESESLRELMKAVPGSSRRPSDDLADSYWTGFANEVMGRIDAAPAKRPGIAARLLGRPEGGGPLAGSRGRRSPAGFGVATVAVAFALVWFLSPGTIVPPRTGDPARQADGIVSDGAPGVVSPLDRGPDSLGEFDRRLSDYFRKSKTLLVGVSNVDPSGGDGPGLDAERRVSRSLLREARYLRTGPVDPGASRLLDDLDRILIGLANRGNASAGPDLETIRGGIRGGNLLFKLRMQETRGYRVPVRNASYQR